MANHSIISLRILRRRPLHGFLTLFGLSVGIAAALLCLLYVKSELGFDIWWPDGIYRVESRFAAPGRTPEWFAKAPGPAKEALGDYFSGDVRTAARLWITQDTVVSDNRAFHQDVAYIDPGLIEIFPLTVIAGSLDAVLSDPSAVALSRKTAERYFGDHVPLGRYLNLTHDQSQEEVVVAAVFEDLPKKSHLDLEITRLFDPVAHAGRPPFADRWLSFNMYLYIRLTEGIDPVRFLDRLGSDFERVKIPVVTAGGRTFDVAGMLDLSLVPVERIHLHSQSKFQIKKTGDLSIVRGFSAVAVLIVAIASVNYASLATAAATLRSREVGLRMLLGAGRSEVMAKILGESAAFVLASCLIAIPMVELLRPLVGQALHVDLERETLGSLSNLFLTVGLVAMVGLAGGLYSALHLSRLRPAEILRPTATPRAFPSRVQSILVTGQFAVSIILMICTVIILAQALHAKSGIVLGYDPRGLLLIRGLEQSPVKTISDTLVRELEGRPGITGVARSSLAPTDKSDNSNFFRRPGDAEAVSIGTASVDQNFFDVYRVPLLAGRYFSSNFASDRDIYKAARESGVKSGNVLINESAARRLGFSTPEGGVGQDILMSWRGDEMLTLTVVGVVKDFRLESVREAPRPMVFRWDSETYRTLTIRLVPDFAQDGVPFLEDLWRRLLPAVPFQVEFLENRLAEQYQAEKARLYLFSAFAFLTILMASLGLYGMVAFRIERQAKEFAIRKIFGADSVRVLGLSLRRFLAPVILANLLGWPVAWYLMREWLAEFEAQIDLTIVPFALAGLASLVIAAVTVSGHIVHLQRLRPVVTLRYE